MLDERSDFFKKCTTALLVLAMIAIGIVELNNFFFPLPSNFMAVTGVLLPLFPCAAIISMFRLHRWSKLEKQFLEFVGVTAPGSRDTEAIEMMQPLIDAKMDEIFETIMELKDKIGNLGVNEFATCNEASDLVVKFNGLRADIRNERDRYEDMRDLVCHFGFAARSERKRSKALAKNR
jgi:hypothetical protein